MHNKDRDEYIMVERFRSPEPLFPLKGQHAQLAKEIVADEERQHGDHPAKHHPMMGICPMSPCLKPADDEEPRKERRHELADIRPNGGVSSEKSRLSQPFKHGSPRRSSPVALTTRFTRDASHFTSFYALH